MGNYSGHNTPVDSSDWSNKVATHRNGEAVPAPAPMEKTDDGTLRRASTPDPYEDGGNGSTLRNFGRA